MGTIGRLCFVGLIGASSALAVAAESLPGIHAAQINDQGEYLNTEETLDHGSLGVRLPFFLRRLGTYFRDGQGAPELQPNDGGDLRQPGTQARATWIGHATFLVQMGGMTFLTDPIWSDVASPVPPLGPRRFVAPGVEIDDLPDIDFVLISHNHYDHLDIPTLRRLSERNAATVFVVPEGNKAILHRAGINNVREANWGEQLRLGALTVYCLPSKHWSKRSLTDTNKALWSSWAVLSESKRFYHAGDTGYFPGFASIGKALGPFDLAALPIGAYAPRQMMKSFHMNPEEAAQAARDLNVNAVVGMHFGTFDLSDEPLDEPPARFRQAAAELGISAKRLWIMNIGETRAF